MRKILIQVWQRKILPENAFELLKQKFKTERARNEVLRDEILAVLEALNEKILTTSEAEEEIKWIMMEKEKNFPT